MGHFFSPLTIGFAGKNFIGSFPSVSVPLAISQFNTQIGLRFSTSNVWQPANIKWIGATRQVGDIAVGAGGLVLAGVNSASGTVLVSSDYGHNFTETNVTGAGAQTLAAADYGNGVFMVMGNNSFTSPDGVNWTTGGAVPSNQFQPTWFGSNNWIGMDRPTGWGGNYALSTNGGTTWASIAPPAGFIGRGEYGGVCYDGTDLLWITRNSGTNAYALAVGNDGSTWGVTQFTNQASQWLLAFRNGVYVCADGAGSFIAVANSPANLAAAAFTSPPGVGVWAGLGVTSGGIIFALSSAAQPKMFTSADQGASWQQDVTTAFSTMGIFGRIGTF